ncbi:MAG: hypothetical protein ACI88G_002019, partial [Woeseiaceae bacterium]
VLDAAYDGYFHETGLDESGMATGAPISLT